MIKPWGEYRVLLEENDYKVKQILVSPGGELSLQAHDHRSEHWVIVRGEATVIINATQRVLRRDQSLEIPRKCMHRISNNSAEWLVLIEVQIGDYLGEDDITRFKDRYGRE